MDELDQLDREAIQCGREAYVALLEKAEDKMKTLVTFWRNCGLVTGQRTLLSSWWKDPKTEMERLFKPQYIQERLDTISRNFGYQSDEGKKLRIIETSRWLESMINSVTSDSLLSSPILEELDIVWRDRNKLNEDDTEDEMIARIRRWKECRDRERLEKMRFGNLHSLGLDTGQG